MPRRIETSVRIAARPETVWRVLIDFAAYPQWNPFVVSIAGTPAPGERLSVSIQPAGRRAMRFRPRVQLAREREVFSWLGRLLVPGLFDGLHEFRLQADAEGTRLVQREEFFGLLAPLVWNGMKGPTETGFNSMNQALKARAEALEAPVGEVAV